jgi:tryptophan 2,3-dioxygenase
MGASFGEEGRRLSYGRYLRIDELIELQSRLTDAHDELLFIVVHQAYELWFRLVLFELEAATQRMSADDAFGARHYIERAVAVERLLIQQVDVLDTMSPQDFLEFRQELAPASGFQSVQFREIEFLSGLKDPAYLDRIELNDRERERLLRRLREPSLWDAFTDLMAKAGIDSIEELFGRQGRAVEMFELSEALLDHDQAFSQWRARHVLMVERQIGSKSGTGGSSGASYLRTTRDKKFFPELWGARSDLTMPGRRS